EAIVPDGPPLRHHRTVGDDGLGLVLELTHIKHNPEAIGAAGESAAAAVRRCGTTGPSGTMASGLCLMWVSSARKFSDHRLTVSVVTFLRSCRIRLLRVRSSISTASRMPALRLPMSCGLIITAPLSCSAAPVNS